MGVYIVTHEPTGRVYVGSSSRIELRQQQIRYQFARKDSAFYDDWKRDGPHAFTFAILEKTSDEMHLYLLEQNWIDYFVAKQSDLLYNRHLTTMPSASARRSMTNAGITPFNIKESRKYDTMFCLPVWEEVAS